MLEMAERGEGKSSPTAQYLALPEVEEEQLLDDNVQALWEGHSTQSVSTGFLNLLV